jgi:hypothetical protein
MILCENSHETIVDEYFRPKGEQEPLQRQVKHRSPIIGHCATRTFCIIETVVEPWHTWTITVMKDGRPVVRNVLIQNMQSICRLGNETLHVQE